MSYSGEFRHLVQHFLLNDDEESYHACQECSIIGSIMTPDIVMVVLEMSIHQESVNKLRNFAPNIV